VNATEGETIDAAPATLPLPTDPVVDRRPPEVDRLPEVDLRPPEVDRRPELEVDRRPELEVESRRPELVVESRRPELVVELDGQSEESKTQSSQSPSRGPSLLPS